VAWVAEGLEVAACPWVTALLEVHDVVDVGGDGAAWAERMCEQDA
jgi:hypothetical protein